jgi:hypothetical protein
MKLFDSFGNMGLLLDYGLIIAFTGSAALLFYYFWKKDRLDFDESPKHQMLKEGEEDSHERRD